MVLIPGGELVMGSDREVDAGPVHTVSVSSFYMDRHEVTQEVYEKVTGQNPSRRKGGTNPVERVRWLDAIKFCNARSLQEGLEPCYDIQARVCHFERSGYRLPTEAEWEHACRAGSTEDYYFGADDAKLDTHAWFKENSRRRPRPVRQKRPNPFGLYDIVGRREIDVRERQRASCVYAPEPAIIMTNQIIGGLMVDALRRLLGGEHPPNLFYDARGEKML